MLAALLGTAGAPKKQKKNPKNRFTGTNYTFLPVDRHGFGFARNSFEKRYVATCRFKKSSVANPRK
jgi:hypothetical protein